MSTYRSTWRSLIVVVCALASVMAGASSASAQERDWREARDQIEQRARSQRGAPYRSGGSSPSGFDCSGFTRWVFQGVDVELPHSSQEQFNMGERDGFKKIWSRERLEPGDLVFFKTTSAQVGHVGIYLGEGKFISSSSSSGVRIDSVWDGYYWGPRWVGATRHPVTQER